MNRVNKFRGYDKVNKRIFEVYGLGVDWCTENTDDGVNEGQNYWADEGFANNVVIMQYVRTNKKGVDIWEGDLIECNGQVCVVIFGEKTLGFGYHVKYNTSWNVVDKFYRINNPELLYQLNNLNQ